MAVHLQPCNRPGLVHVSSQFPSPHGLPRDPIPPGPPGPPIIGLCPTPAQTRASCFFQPGPVHFSKRDHAGQCCPRRFSALARSRCLAIYAKMPKSFIWEDPGGLCDEQTSSCQCQRARARCMLRTERARAIWKLGRLRLHLLPTNGLDRYGEEPSLMSS